MATQKVYNYILVMTPEGPKFVTSIGEKKTARWDELEVPMQMPSLEHARDVAFGLTVNGNVAFSVSSLYEIESQPYFYSKGHFEWKFNEETTN